MKNGITIGLDMGDKKHRMCVLDEQGEVISRETVTNTMDGLRKAFKGYEGATVVMEAGTHSAWVSRAVEGLGLRVLIGNPRKLRAIWDSWEKDDDRDAEMLGRIGRFDPKLLYPIHHRGEQAQKDLARIKARDQLVQARTQLVNHVRGTVKGMGERLSSCSTESFHKVARQELSEAMYEVLKPVVDLIEQTTEKVRQYDKAIERLCQVEYEETARLRQVSGVGSVTALAYVLSLEEQERFEKSRSVGPFLGLTPRRDQSGETDKQLRISKAGNGYLRRLLVGCSQYIMGPFGPDCDLRRHGERIAARGGKNAKRRAVVAVARKLGVLLHHLWRTGEEYQLFHPPVRRRRRAA